MMVLAKVQLDVEWPLCTVAYAYLRRTLLKTFCDVKLLILLAFVN
jgi:hypothetical protein